MHYLLASWRREARCGWRDRALSLSSHLSEENMLAEAAFLRGNPSWERPYGWAWAVELNRVVNASEVDELRVLGPNTQVLADTVFDLASTWLPKVAAPVRHGVHSNTAFGLRRILIGARVAGRDDIVDVIAGAARRFFAEDVAWNFVQERSGHDFLSPACEADLAEISPRTSCTWLPEFLSNCPQSPALTPVSPRRPTVIRPSLRLGTLGRGVSVALAPKLGGSRRTRAMMTSWLRQRHAHTSRFINSSGEAAVSGEYVSSMARDVCLGSIDSASRPSALVKSSCPGNFIARTACLSDRRCIQPWCLFMA